MFHNRYSDLPCLPACLPAPSNARWQLQHLYQTFITEKHIQPDLTKLLPRDDSKSPERPSEAAFRLRM